MRKKEKEQKSLLKHVSRFYNKSFRTLLTDTKGSVNIQTDKKNKGRLGQIIERCIFKKDPNNDKNPDLNYGEDHVYELKVTPYKINKNNTKSQKRD